MYLTDPCLQMLKKEQQYFFLLVYESKLVYNSPLPLLPGDFQFRCPTLKSKSRNIQMLICQRYHTAVTKIKEQHLCYWVKVWWMNPWLLTLLSMYSDTWCYWNAQVTAKKYIKNYAAGWWFRLFWMGNVWHVLYYKFEGIKIPNSLMFVAHWRLIVPFSLTAFSYVHLVKHGKEYFALVSDL